jgi:uncharacterized protein
VSCCPTNFARTMASLGAYTATKDSAGVRIELLAGAEIRTELPGGRTVGLRVTTGYPWRGRVAVQVTESDGAPWCLSVRVPSWARGATLTTGGQRRDAPAGQYAQVERPWRAGDEIVLELPMAPRWTFPDPRIDAVRGTVAVERGPFVYCMESVDLPDGAELDRIAVVTSAQPADAPADTSAPQAVTVSAVASPSGGAPQWPYGAERPALPTAVHDALRMIPFYARANRGPALMRVFLPESPK